MTSQTADVQPRPQPKPAVTDFACSYAAIRSHSLPFNCLHLRNPHVIRPTWITNFPAH